MKQKVLSLILALILSVNVLPMSAMAETSENIQKTAFADVKQNDWFFENVNTAVDLGLMVGVGDGKFAPSDEVTLAMAVTMASRVHSIYVSDGEKFENTGDTWYQPYVDYAKKNGIIADAMDWEAEATRVAIAQMFARSLPEKALKAINTVDEGMIPDVKSDLAVYTLYRAGVFVGSDEKGSFHPDTAITRAEISAVVSRMLDEDLRATITLKAEETKKPITGGGSSSGGSSSKPAEEIKPEEVIGENNELKVPFDQAFPEAMESEDIKYDDKTLMIKFKKSFDGTVTDELSNAGVVSLEHMMDLEDAVWYTAYIKDGDEVETVLEKVRKLSNVIVAELNFTAEASSTGIVENVDISHHDGNHRVHEQWHLKAGGLVRGWNHMKEHNVPEGGSSNVVVAVIDTGVDYTHEDLRNNIWVNTAEIPDNNIDDDGNGYIDDYYGVNINTKKGNGNDDNGHGTHVAGIIAAADNNTGVLGVAYNAKIMPIKAGMSSGYFLQSDIANSILYAYNHGADVINMSFGGAASSIAVQDALAVAYNRCILVAAAGNDGKPNEYVPGWGTMPTYPAALKYVLGVMSVDDQGVEASYSNWDVEAFNSVEYELYAPGSAILSTLPGDRYASWNGTSMAAPYVSGVAALLRSYYSDTNTYPTKFIYGQLASTSETEAKCIDPSKSGHGAHNLPMIVDAYSALTKLPKPDIGVMDYTIFDSADLSANNNGDGVIDAGETIAIGFELNNRWSISKDTIVSVDTNSPYVSIRDNNQIYGGIGTYSVGDAGKVYTGDVWTGWEKPIYLEIAEDCPNDYIVALNVNLSYKNGLDENDNTIYEPDPTTITLNVRRGKILPNLIKEDMTLTADNYYIIPNATTIQEGATVIVEPGTHIQFWTDDPNDAYADTAIVCLRVEGKLLCQGTADNHIVMKPSELMGKYRVQIYESGNGYVSLEYTDITNPHLYANDSANYENYPGITRAYGCEFTQNFSDDLYYRYLSGGKVSVEYPWNIRTGMNIVNAEACKYYNMGGGHNPYYMYGNYNNCLFADSEITDDYNSLSRSKITFTNCVFYGNSNIDNGTYGNVSTIELYDNNKPQISWINKIVRNDETGITYVQMQSSYSAYIDRIAKVTNGKVADYGTQDEIDFIKENFGTNYGIDGSTDSIIELPSSDIDYINLNSYDVTIDMENPFQIEATVEPTSANAEDLVYTADESGVVEVSETGLITGLQTGSAKVYVSSPDRYVTATIDVTVKEKVELEAITLSDDELYLDVGDTWYTAPVLSPTDTSMTRLTFASSDEAVATVNNMGVITAKGIGNTEITATGINGVSTTLDLRVGISPESISFDSKYYMAGLGTTELPEVIFVPENTTETELTWETADSSIAEVIDGELICNGIGTTILRATTQNGKSADIYINVNEETTNSPIVEYMSTRYNKQNPSHFMRCADGTVWYWSQNAGIPQKLTVDGEILTGITDMSHNDKYYSAVYERYLYFLKADGTVDAYELLRDGKGALRFVKTLDITDVKEISITTNTNSPASNGYSVLFLKNDGSLWQQTGGTPDYSIIQLDTETVGIIIDVASTKNMIFTLNEDGEVWRGNISDAFKLFKTEVTALQDMNGNNAYISIYTEEEIYPYYGDGDGINAHFPLISEKMFARSESTYYINNGEVYRYNAGNPLKIGNITNAELVLFGDDTEYITTKDGKVYAIGTDNSYNALTSMFDGVATIQNPFEMPFGLSNEQGAMEIKSKNLDVDNLLSENALIIEFSSVVTKSNKFTEINLSTGGNTVSTNRLLDLNKLYIKPIHGFQNGAEYTLTIPSGAFKTLDSINNDALEITFTIAEGELRKVYPENYEKPQSPVLPEAPADSVVIDETVERFEWTAETIIAKCEEARPTGIFSDFTGNAILNRLYDDNVEHWLRPEAGTYSAYTEIDLGGNWWGTTDKFLIGKQILDYDDYQTLGDILEDNILTAAPENVWPFVTEAYLENAEGERVETIGNEAVTFVLKFNRDMNIEVPFTLAFGSTYPFADYEVEGDYVDSRTWKGSTTLTTLIENGTQYLNIKGAIGDDGREIPWDRGRFVFNIDTTSALAMTLQGEADDNGIKLTWWQDDFDTLAGYNIYRSESEDGFYQKLNSTILTEKEFYDDTVEPGKVYYYNFTVVKTDLSESTPSGKTVIRAKDTMSPTMYHTPIYTAYTGSNLIVNATVTDNVAVNNVTLYYRTVGDAEWKSLAMTNLNDKYSAVINANNITTAGLEYYIDAYDGVTHAYRGTETEPYVVTVKLAVSNNQKGDVDGNGKINLLDALLILQAINDRYNMNEEEFLRADLDGSGELVAWEALRVMQYSNGKISSVLPDTEEE